MLGRLFSQKPMLPSATAQAPKWKTAQIATSLISILPHVQRIATRPK
ncbi:hypothetical protein RRSWK_06750 [Rhodopirellula sp. SWK7]|nr:hypothetical protein RRSWK_06750 [Rhodopirellula sp. SWK7]